MMTMFRTALIGIVLAACGSAALADQPPAMHDKAWYVANAQKRWATVVWCHGDATRSDLHDCQNAEAAASVAMAMKNGRDPLGYLDTVDYWLKNPISRAGAQLTCQSRAPGAAGHYRYCNVVATAASFASRRN
jgi:hypothetical protein